MMEVRGAVLRVAGQGRRANRLQRPVQRLYPLEMTLQGKQSDATGSSNPAIHELNDKEPTEPSDMQMADESPGLDTTPSSLPTRRSERTAALEARDCLLAQTLDGEDPFY